MKRNNFLSVILLLGLGIAPINAQVTSASSNLVAQPISDRTISFCVTDTGVSKPITWGLDLAWLSEVNVRRGIAFMGKDNVDVVRSSFTPTAPLVDGELAAAELSKLNERLSIISLLGPNTKVVLNCDHSSVDSWFVGNAARWAQLIDITTKHHTDQGRAVVTVSPFNEPDYTATGQGTITDFYNIAGELRNNSRFDTIRISGGNTLNTDQALPWYNTLKDRLDEGNTHQLAGSFDNYASFFQTVRANGDHATNDELHNVMEAMVGVEYGMQTGIWWGTAEFARGEFVRASDGKRLGYAEHRPNWTAASVYRNPDGQIQAFVGESERQAATTTYRFVSKDRDVYYDGHGPQREYTQVMPGGTGYQVGQNNAEKVINITWGDDIQPIIGGTYVVVNRNSRKVMEVAGGSTSTTSGANIQQNANASETNQQWTVTPVDSVIGGDFSYFSFIGVGSAKSLDILNWSLDNGGNIILWESTKGVNQQWYLEYAGDGWFYIRSRYSAKCLEVAGNSIYNGASIQQSDKDGGTNQQWRFIPVGTTVEFKAPSAPSNVVATANAESVQLTWSASPETDVAGYTIFRSSSAGGSYNTIARNVKTTSFVDNTATTAGQYFYTIKAVDKALNHSVYSTEVSATTTGNHDLVAHLEFEDNTLDSTINLNHSASYGDISYPTGKIGAKAIGLSGTKTFVQLPATVANQEEMTIATWAYWRNTTSGQHLFDFGNDATEGLFLTPRSSSGLLTFTIRKNGVEQSVSAPSMLARFKWSHVAVTLSASGARIYVNGVLVGESNAITITPMDIQPVLNYLGRSQSSSDPFFYGYLDDFRVYNYALPASDVARLAGIYPDAISEVANDSKNGLALWPSPADDVLHIDYSAGSNNSLSTLLVYDMAGKVVMSKTVNSANDTEINVSSLSSGKYILKLTNKEKTLMKEFFIKR